MEKFYIFNKDQLVKSCLIDGVEVFSGEPALARTLTLLSKREMLDVADSMLEEISKQDYDCLLITRNLG